MSENQQWVAYPHAENIGTDLEPQDKLIYLAIRRYMNEDTMRAYPSYSKITEDTGAAPRTILKCVQNLVNAGYLETSKKGRKIVYQFNNQKQFEAFSYDFLDKKDLSFTEKAYIVATQQYMFKDPIREEGRISYTNAELSKIINMPEATISKCNRSLQSKGYMDLSDPNTKRFQLRELDQLIIWKLKEQDDRLDRQDDRLDHHESEIEMLKREIAQLKLENKELRKGKTLNAYVL